MMWLRGCLVLVLVAALAGCGGGAPSITVPPPTLPTLSPDGGVISLPAISTYSGTLRYAANDAHGATLSIAATTQTGTPLPGTWGSLWQNNPLVSYILIPSATVTFSAPLTLVVDMGSNMPKFSGGPFSADEIDATAFDLNAQTQPFGGSARYPSDFSGTTATFSLPASGTLALTAGHTYQIVLNAFFAMY